MDVLVIGHEEVTPFKSLGIWVEDVAAAHHLHERARRVGAGVAVAPGGGLA